MLTALTIAAGLFAFGSFAWGVRRHFRIEAGMPARMSQLSACSTAAFLLFVALVLLRGVSPASAWIAILLFLAGGGLFWWAVQTTRARPPAIAHTNNTPTLLHADGPYARVRHPFYLAYGLGWLGTAVAAGPIQWIPAALLILWYHRTALEEERHFAASSLASEYADYRARTGLILPRLFRP